MCRNASDALHRKRGWPDRKRGWLAGNRGQRQEGDYHCWSDATSTRARPDRRLGRVHDSRATLSNCPPQDLLHMAPYLLTSGPRPQPMSFCNCCTRCRCPLPWRLQIATDHGMANCPPADVESKNCSRSDVDLCSFAMELTCRYFVVPREPLVICQMWTFSG